LEGKSIVLLISDSLISNDALYEDICGLLNNGEVTGLFPLEEKLKIIDEISVYMPVGTINQKWSKFVSNCSENLHLIICMSPAGESFRRRIRKFPGLVNCTTIDWFLSWPEEALRYLFYLDQLPRLLYLI
jgi:dynein heavy chain